MAKRILIACELSGVVRDAFAARGFDAWSCDLEPSEKPGKHIIGDVRQIINAGWDAMIAFPPCTYLANSGARWQQERPERLIKQRQALEFVRLLMDAPIPCIAIENPVGKISTAIRPPDQIIQPYQFGHNEVKTTCLWLKGFYPLVPTKITSGRVQRCWYMPPSEDRSKERSRTYYGIAQAMAQQWGDALLNGGYSIQLILPFCDARPNEPTPEARTEMRER